MDHFDNVVTPARLLTAPSTSCSPLGQALPSSPPSGSPLVHPRVRRGADPAALTDERNPDTDPAEPRG